MADIERWTIRSAHDFYDNETGERYRLGCRVRGPELRDEIEVVRADVLAQAVEAMREARALIHKLALERRSTEGCGLTFDKLNAAMTAAGCSPPVRDSQLTTEEGR